MDRNKENLIDKIWKKEKEDRDRARERCDVLEERERTRRAW